MDVDFVKARDIFLAAVEKQEGVERNAFLDAACGQDQDLRRHVDLLLHAHGQPGVFLERGALATGFCDQPPLEQPGTRIGPYQLLREVGQGGMGVVFLAEQQQPIHRQVALKIIKPGMDTREVIARFEAERRALALMDHLHIARVLDAGTTASGRPYFVMDFVEGVSLTEYCVQARVPTRQRLELFVPVCEAVQHAHQKGIIHRDIKPSNVLVALHDGKPVPKVIDFGIARATTGPLTDASRVTGLTQLVGTPMYMSPEQAEVGRLDVDTRTDVYSLGVLLYELLTDTTPFDRDRFSKASLDDLRRIICDEEPPRPSARISTLCARHDTTLLPRREGDDRNLNQLLRGELDWIVLKAMEKDRAHRYESASALAADIQRYLRDEAVQACPPSLRYRLRKFTRKHRVAVAAALVTTTAILCGSGVAVWQAVRARDALVQANDAQQQLAERYRIAKEAVDAYLLRVTQDERLDHPAFRELRRRLLEAALPYYDQLHELAPTDELSRAARAEALNQLGRVKHELGSFAESRAAYEEAALAFDQLAVAHAERVAYRQGLANVLVNLAHHYRTRGASHEMLEYERHALALREQLAAEYPGSAIVQLELAQSCTNVGVGTPDEAGRQLLEQAIQIWQQLADPAPDTPLYREYLSLGYQNLAQRVAWTSAEEAIPLHTRAIELRKELAGAQPASKQAQLQWARSHEQLADTLEILSSRLDEARTSRDEALRILRACAARHPSAPDVMAELARAEGALAHTLKELGQLELAHDSCQAALGSWQQLATEYPDVVEYAVGLAGVQHELGTILVARDQPNEGLPMMAQARERLQELLTRLGPHDESQQLLRSVYVALQDARRSQGQDSDKFPDQEETREYRVKAAGEALPPSKLLTDLSSLQTPDLRTGADSPILAQTAEKEQTVKRHSSFLPPSKKRNGQRTQRKPGVERLEDRTLLTLVSYWTADNTAEDAVGTNDGTLINGASYAAGPVNQAFRFDGVDDRVQVADSPTLALTESLTIEAWVRADSIPAGQGNILFRGDDRGGLDPYSLFVASRGEAVMFFSVNGLTEGAHLTAVMPIGEFVHVAATLEDATGAMRLYFNGVLMAQTTTTVRPFGELDPNRNPEIVIGNGLHGLIDELKVYENALTAEDVLANFNASKGSMQPTVSISDVTTIEGDPSIRYLGNFVSGGEGGLYDPLILRYSPDGALYVSTYRGNSVLRFDGVTGAPLPAPGKPGAEFVSPDADGLSYALGIDFDPDGNLYVVSGGTNSVLCYDGTTGNLLKTFVASGAGGLDGPSHLLFHNDGNDTYLYVTSGFTDAVLRFDADTGVPAGISGVSGDAVFIAPGSGGLDGPNGIVSRDGDFFVVSVLNNSVLRYAADGRFLGTFVPPGSGGLNGAVDLIFREGFLYLTSWVNNKVLRYDGATGAFIDEVASGEGLVRPVSMALNVDGDLLVTSGDSGEIRRYGTASQAVMTVSLQAPFPTPVSVDYATASGTATAGSDFTASQGTITFAPGVSVKTIVVPVIDDTTTEPTETFMFNLSNPVGGTLADGQAVVTIQDNDPFTKFYVVNDGSPDRTYEYQETGAAVEDYALNSGNTAPRGAASTAVGTQVWVVDANKKVFVYDTSGASLGSWTAGGLQSAAQLVGVATNGTDVWIVDNKADRVYRYTNAAGLISGTQNAASSFSLNSGNRNPSDIVTDGNYLWVLESSKIDKVFKYTVGGTYVGSWTISTSGATSPTGITLDPSNVSHLWIVDSGTDCVYQYNNAASLTSGSKAADLSFALASGNTNPQGIADPPALGSLLTTETSVHSEPVSAETALRGNDAALESMYYEPLKKSRIDTARPSVSRKVETHARDLSYSVGAAPDYLTDDNRWVNDNDSHSDVDDLFAQWDSDPLELLSLPDLGA